jgi:hypothetical protein
VLHREAVQALLPVRLEKVGDLCLGERVPVLIVEKLDGNPPDAPRVPGDDT